MGGDRFRYGCVLEFHIAEGKGSICYDQSGLGNDGTIYGATWQKGPMVYALSFDGVDDCIEVPPPVSGLPLGSSPRALELLISIKEGYWLTSREFFGYGVGATRRAFGLDTAEPEGMLEVWTWGDDFSFDTGKRAGEWIHLVITYDGGVTIKAYSDGTLKHTHKLGAQLDTGESSVRFASSFLTRYSGCYIALGRIYERPLSDEEVFALYSYLFNPTISVPTSGVG